MMNITRARQADHEARQEAQTVFDHPVVLEAGAGTGKTATLVARILVWAVGRGWERASLVIADNPPPVKEQTTARIAAQVMERIVAITFTERAAAEMAHRVAMGLDAVRSGNSLPGLSAELLPGTPQEQKERCTALLGHVDRLSVQTIHAFCRGLLAQAPLDAGLHPMFQVDADGSRLKHIIEDVIAEHMDTAYGQTLSPDLQILMAAGLGPQRFAELLRDLATDAIPTRALAEDPYAPSQVDALAQEIYRLCHALLDTIETPLESASPGRIKTALATLDQVRLWAQIADKTPSVDSLVPAFSDPSVDKVLKRLAKWGRDDWSASEADALGENIEIIPAHAAKLHGLATHISRFSPVLLPALCRVLHPLLEHVENQMTSKGVVTFSGLLRKASKLLEEHPTLRQRYRRNIDQLLVDEFQDTDPEQCAIVRLLALDGDPEERPGLFLVGDPKQSIYGWRNADLNAYETFINDVVGQGGVRHSLTVNFRSVPAILDEVERAMAPVMHHVPGVSPAFEPLIPTEEKTGEKGFSRENHRPVEYWVSWDHNEGICHPQTLAARARQVEAEALARDIESLHTAEGIPYGKMAILMRSTSDIDIYLSALRQVGVPFVVERDRNYFQRREIIDATALARTILDPNDHLALITVLRSSCVGVPDAALLGLWNRGFPGLFSRLTDMGSGIIDEIRDVVNQTKADLPETIPGLSRIEGWNVSLMHAVESIGFLRESFTVLPSDHFVTHMRTLFLQEATESARYLGAHRLANLERFYRNLTEDLSNPTLSVSTLLERLREGVREHREEQEGTPGDASMEAVRVLTIHKAKGLTFDHVYVVGLHGEMQAGRRDEKAHAQELENGYALCLAGFPSASYHHVQEIARRTELAELTRTLYVAMTRPAQRLVLLGRWEANPTPANDRPQSHLALLGHRANGVSLTDLAETSDGNGARMLDSFDTLWRIPPPPCDEHWTHTKESGPTIPTLEEAQSEYQTIVAFRKEAIEQSSRPMLSTPSGMAHPAASLPKPAASAEDRLQRRVARAVGIALHRVLETFDLSKSVEEECEIQRGLISAYLNPLLPDTVLEEAEKAAEEQLDALARSSLLHRLKEVEILGREVPFFDEAREDGIPSTEAVVGLIDLIYRDGEEVVVVDYKTDRVSTEEEIQSRAQIYATQGEYYCRAIQKALQLKNPPPFELWFLLPGTSIRVNTRA